MSGLLVKFKLYSLADGEASGKKTFVLRAEKYGVPQARHRVIIVGVREDIGDIIPDCLDTTDQVPI